MKKMILGALSLVLVLVFSGCVNVVQKPAEKIAGKFFEIGYRSFAWGGETQTVCNDGRIYSVATNADFANFLGFLTAKNVDKLQGLIGTNTIAYKEVFDTPNTADASYEVSLNYNGEKENQDIDYDKYVKVDKALESMVKDLERQEVLSIRRDSGLESIVQWKDSAILSFKAYVDGKNKIDASVDFKDLNPKQLEIINRMASDYEQRGLNTGVAEYAIEEDGLIYDLQIYSNFLSITTWPKVVYTMEQMTKLLSIDTQQLTDMDHVTAKRVEVLIERVTDSEIVKAIRENHFGYLWVVWNEGGKKVGSKYDVSLAFGDPQVGLDEICK